MKITVTDTEGELLNNSSIALVVQDSQGCREVIYGLYDTHSGYLEAPDEVIEDAINNLQIDLVVRHLGYVPFEVTLWSTTNITVQMIEDLAYKYGRDTPRCSIREGLRRWLLGGE